VNFIELDSYLRKHSASEERYLKEPELSGIYNNESRELIDGRYVYNFLKSRTPFPFNEDFLIKKHSRFIPVPEHIHGYIELNFVYSGQCQQKINNQDVLLQKGDIVLIDTEIPHSIAKTGEEDIIINLMLSQIFFTKCLSQIATTESYLSQFLLQAISDTQKHNQYLIFRNNDPEKLLLLFQQFLCEVFDPGIATKEMQSLYIQLIFLELIRSFSVEVNGTDLETKQTKLALDILAFIEANYETCSLGDTALHFGYNSSYFSNMIRKTTGMSFKDLILNKRLEKSRIELIHSTKPVRDIALDCGFSNLNHYYRLFQERFGMTPSKYRKDKKNSE
jgi:AraC-like DNA-binding protein